MEEELDILSQQFGVSKTPVQVYYVDFDLRQPDLVNIADFRAPETWDKGF